MMVIFLRSFRNDYHFLISESLSLLDPNFYKIIAIEYIVDLVSKTESILVSQLGSENRRHSEMYIISSYRKCGGAFRKDDHNL